MANQRIIIVDDSDPIHLLIRARLSGEPVEITGAHDGTSGLAMIREQLPDLVLLDIEMPSPDGFEVCRALKADPATMNIPVIFITGAAQTAQKIRGLEMGAVDYVTKPFDPAELRARVRAALRLKFLLDLLSRKAQIDGLTGLWNRAYFDTRLVEEESLARRSGGELCCLMLDIDHFKSVNDKYGHPFGDEVLRGVVGAMNEQLRAEDTLCRYGGEEFVLLLRNTPGPGAKVLAERLLQHIAQAKYLWHGKEVSITASVGIAQFDTRATTGMLQRADTALYAAKGGGRNRAALDQTILPATAAA